MIPESDSTFGIVRNDGRSIHHRNELEKAVLAIDAKIAELKAQIDLRGPSTSLGMTDRVDELGGS